MSDAPSPLARRLLSEDLGTAILVATVIGSGITAERLAGGNQAIALSGNTIPTGAGIAISDVPGFVAAQIVGAAMAAAFSTALFPADRSCGHEALVTGE